MRFVYHSLLPYVVSQKTMCLTKAHRTNGLQPLQIPSLQGENGLYVMRGYPESMTIHADRLQHGGPRQVVCETEKKNLIKRPTNSGLMTGCGS